MDAGQDRLPEEAQQKQNACAPKVPHRAQKGGEHCKIENGTAGCAQQNVAPQLSLRLTQHEKKHRYAHNQAEEHVQRGSQAPEGASPEGPEQIVYQRRRHSQQDGLSEERQLLGDVDAHGVHPSSRRKKPGRCASPSS